MALLVTGLIAMVIGVHGIGATINKGERIYLAYALTIVGIVNVALAIVQYGIK